MTYGSRDLFGHLARYNRRANIEAFSCADMLTDKARRRDIGSWFRSLHGLLNHILVADLYWLNRFRPIYPESRVLADPALSPDELSWSREIRENFEGMREMRTYVDDRLIAWFEECPEDRYGNHFQYSDAAGNVRNATAGAAFEFLFVHQTHHRGQISQVLDTLGLPNNFADNAAFLEGKA